MLRENIEKDLEDIIKIHEINSTMLRDVCFAIVTADYLDGTNQKELNIDKFVSASSKQWRNILSILNVSEPREQTVELPDVQKMRILCDALTIVTRGSFSETRFLSEVSSKIAQVMGVNLKAGSYKDIEDCYGVFDKYTCLTDKDYPDTFNFISENLKKMADIDKTLKKPIFKDYDFSSVYLGKGYDNYGFSTSSNIPAKLGAAKEFEDFEDYIRLNFINEVITCYIKRLTKDVTDNIDMVTLLRKLTVLKNKGSSYIPIGIKCRMSELNIIRLPQYPNEVLNKYLADIFSENILLSDMSLQSVFNCVKVLNPEVRSVI